MDNPQNFQIVVCGGGNGAHATAGYAGSKSFIKVNVFTRKPKEWKKQIIVSTEGSAWEYKGNITGQINKASNNLQELCQGSKIWLICGPASIHETLLKQIQPYVGPKSYVGTIFAQGGFDWMANSVFGKRLKEDDITIFGLYNIPWICKIATYGERVRIIGPKESLYVTVSPKAKEEYVMQFLENIYDIPTVTIPNFLSLTLTPSNQIIHPGRIYGVFKNWDGKSPYKQADIPLFYEDLDDFSAWMLKLLDDEIQAIKKEINNRFPDYDLSQVIPLKDRIKKQYGNQVKDHSNIKQAFRTNQGYRTVQIPVLQVDGGVIPNINGRIFWEDVPYGLCILHEIAKMVGINTPATDKMILWHQKFMNKHYLVNGKLNQSLIQETGVPSKYGFTSIEQLLGIAEIKPQPKL